MDRYKKLILLLVVFGSIHLVAVALMPTVSSWIFDIGYKNRDPFAPSYTYASVAFSYIIVWLPVAIWIYKDSKKDFFTPWLWALLILIASYQGVIIYLLMRLLIDKEKYTDETIGKLKVVEDFLPPPDQLDLKA